MNGATKWRLKKYLAEQNMFDVIELLEKGASKQEVIDLFEKHNILSQSQEYRRLQKKSQNKQSRRLNNRITRLLQLVDQE
ncbi:hypothetical protein [Bacillus cihuensis]|uniref:hypothetical protein n=1 Tax=Bacillus cihuensis TaxID=1208599 RepID=UPI00048E40FD|nr:hypothetical protein [Bacillus cihuensis]